VRGVDVYPFCYAILVRLSVDLFTTAQARPYVYLKFETVVRSREPTFPTKSQSKSSVRPFRSAQLKIGRFVRINIVVTRYIRTVHIIRQNQRYALQSIALFAHITMFSKYPQECSRRSLKVRKWVWTGTATALLLIVGVAVTVAILLSNNKQDPGTVSETSSDSKNQAPPENSTFPWTDNVTAPVAVPWATMAPSLLNETNDINSTLAPTTSGGITVDNSTSATAAPIAVSAPVSLAPATPSPTYLNEPITTIFYAHGDIPYNDSQKIVLEEQMRTVPLDAEFVIYVGDMRAAGDDKPCLIEQFTSVADWFRLSHAPVFVIQGDNDVGDCPNEDGKHLWSDQFVGFESKYWNHTFDIKRQEGYPDNFAFVHKKTLFMGLDIIGGETRNATEWEIRLGDEALWTMDLIRMYRSNATDVGRVVIFGHANPGVRHATYFQTISSFIRNELTNSIPILYLNGDKHAWTYEPNFYSNESWLRIGVTGLGEEPLLKVTIEADGTFVDPEQAFVIDRMLDTA
jgi:hypothetical protein